MENPRRQLSRFNLFCLASRSDNYPLAIIDAMLAGLPVVAAGVGGIAEAIEESGCGRVVAPENPGLLAGAMRHFLTDLRRLPQPGRAARRTLGGTSMSRLSRARSRACTASTPGSARLRAG